MSQLAERPAQYAGTLGLPLVHQGKVRELYQLPEDLLLMVATDAISAFDFVLAKPVPDKGAILTQLSSWWFDQLDVQHHLRSAQTPGYPGIPAAVADRAVVCERLEMIPVECVGRGYLTGSGWLEYCHDRTVCGVPLPPGLHDGARLPEPIFTPATKAAVGEHDENVSFDVVSDQIGRQDATAIRDLTLRLYTAASERAAAAGLILADTKFEFGKRRDGTIVLGDEVLTPDSSRFWDADGWRAGRLDSFDKQFLRNWLLNESGWDRSAGGPPPPVPDDVIAATRTRYLEAFERLTGRAFCTNVLVTGRFRQPAARYPR